MAPLTVADIVAFLEEFAPTALSEDWDNVGLLVGRHDQPVARIMTCLTITPASAAEALARQANLIVTHHPLPFVAIKRITDATTTGGMLLDLIGSHIAVYSPHTAFDSAPQGINQRLALGLGLQSIVPLLPTAEGTGAGRLGSYPAPQSLAQVIHLVKNLLGVAHVQVVGANERLIQRVGVACGSGGGFLEAAVAARCDLFLTGEARFHSCLEAEAREIALILAGHFATERFSVEQLAAVLGQRFPQLEVWTSEAEADPLRWD